MTYTPDNLTVTFPFNVNTFARIAQQIDTAISSNFRNGRVTYDSGCGFDVYEMFFYLPVDTSAAKRRAVNAAVYRLAIKGLTIDWL